MQVNEWLKKTVAKFKYESGTAQLDAEVILAHVLDVDRSWLHAHPEFEINNDKISTLTDYTKRRAYHEPLAYILKKTEFYGREFYITSGVLVPRPESESMIDLFKKYISENKINDALVVDVGTGSGALIITAALEAKPTQCVAIDIDDTCLSVANQNIDKYKVNVCLEKGDLLEPIKQKNFNQNNIVVLANLPYVPKKYSINMEAKNEPAHAIFGGEDGLDLYRKLFLQLSLYKDKKIAVFTESLPFQHQELKAIATEFNFVEKTEDDFIQVFEL